MKNLKVLGLLVFVILAMAACSSNANTKVDEKDKMKDDMKSEMKDGEMKDGMKSEMKDGEMKDGMKHEMKDGEMKDGMKSEMKDGEMKDGMKSEMKDGEMKDGMKSEMKDGEMKDGMKHEMKDGEMKDGMKSEMKDGEMKDGMKHEMKDGEMKDGMKSEMKDGEMKDGMKSEMKDGMKKDEMKDDMKSEKMNEGEVAKDFTLVDRDGKEVTLSSLKGKKTYVKFWASWCSICLAGLEELNDLAGKDNEFEIVTVVSPGVRGEKSKDDFIKWFDTLGYKNVRVLFDEEGQVMNQFGVRAFPTSVFIGSDSVHVKTLLGHQSNDAILETMSSIK